MQLRIEVRLDSYNDPNSYGNFGLSETVDIGNLEFLELASILGKFHEVLGAIKKAHDAKQG